MHNHHHEDPYSRQGRPPWAGAMTDDQPYRRRRGRGRGFGPGSPGSFFGQGPRANRGDIRAAILALLAERPMHGYQIIQEITDRSGGVWAPSPGSVYPTLQHLEDEGLVTADTTEGKKVFSLTAAGQAANEARGATTAPWEEVGRRHRPAGRRRPSDRPRRHRRADRGGDPPARRDAPVAVPDPRRGRRLTQTHRVGTAPPRAAPTRSRRGSWGIVTEDRVVVLM